MRAKVKVNNKNTKKIEKILEEKETMSKEVEEST